ncbi:SRPBCC family protein [Psychroserpens sp. S379A]|uniref:SRPBCC family protein n=1 Tax=Psychroserpens sp. S379A TaxID=3415137 RepID=UPI003C7EBED5
MTIVFYVLGAIVLLLIVLALIAPKQYQVERNIVIDKPLPDVFNYLKHIKNQDYWSPWKKRDPNMKQEFIGTDGEVGFIAKWDGNKDVGLGEQEITNIVENDRVEARLRFFKPWKSESDALTKVEDAGEGKTKVTWGFSGINKVPANIFMMLYNVDKHVGKDFEEGLTSLKDILESK